MIYIHPTIFKTDSKGKIRVWSMERDENRYRTISGIKDGACVATGWTVCAGKNIGRVNETTPDSQAIAEVEASYKKKLEGEYVVSLDTLGDVDLFKPMLAQDFAKLKTEIWGGDGMIFTQPKLDGIRCIARASGLWSRKGKKITACDHIFQQLKWIFAKHPDLVLDGELYNHDLKDDFNEITSMVRKQTVELHEQEQIERMVQYHIYDLFDPAVPDQTYLLRHAQLAAVLKLAQEPTPNLFKVKTLRADKLDQLDRYYALFLEEGYEGQMIRLNDAYQNTRSWSLMKRKEFLDAEFKIARIEEGNGNWLGYAKRVIFYLPDGRECGAGIRGDQAYCKKLLAEAVEYSGGASLVTIRYFTPTPDGMPRFPVATAFFKQARDL